MNNMNDKMNLKKTLKDSLLWIIMAAATTGAFIVSYCYNGTALLHSLMWLVWFVIMASSFFYTAKGQQAYSFAKESKVELEKVVWPSRQETTQTTMIVVVMVTVAGFVLWGIDSGMLWGIGKLTHLG